MLAVNTALFKGLDPQALADIARQMVPRHYQAGELLCRQGEPGDRLYLIESGLAEVFTQGPDSPVLLDRLRRGDILGEMALITGEPRAASAVTVMPTAMWELSRDSFAAIIARYPEVLFNISHILVQRQKRSNTHLLEQRCRGEAAAVVVDQHAEAIVADTIAALQSSNPHTVAVIDLTGTLATSTIALEEPNVASALTRLDNLLVDYRTVITVVRTEQQDIQLLMRSMDRVELIAELTEALQIYSSLEQTAKSLNCILLTQQPENSSENIDDLAVLHTLSPAHLKDDCAWLRRHLLRKKIGLALGAGGAKGYAHVGVLSVLEQAGMPIDYVAGSSIGAAVGSFLAMGMDAATIAKELRRIWSPEVVSELNVFSPEGFSVGLQKAIRGTTEQAGELTFADLDIPLTIMTADLNAQQAAPIREGRLAEALRAAMTIPGMVPPLVRGSQRLVDGITIVPVPAAAVRAAGADIVISVNLLHRDTIAAWPTEAPPPPPVHRQASRTLDPVIETLIMLQLDTSVHNAAEADVVITPRFPPVSWRDFYLADLIHDTGMRAIEEQFPRLRNLVKV